jgi:serine/threonine protein kinase
VPNILSCPSCAAVVVPQEAGTVCPRCHAPLLQSDLETMPADGDVTRLASEGHALGSAATAAAGLTGANTPTAPPRQTDRAGGDPRSSGGSGAAVSSGWLSSSGAIDHGRFAPGALLGGRYRIIQRLGRGGMGEVYRADDLKLGQPVALKFLPGDVDRDPGRLTQLHTEVRMARQVSHPNVCRVYDIDEVDGSTFLSMEFVDGEDLASLLRRIGRFPEDRALEIARQICAGLAAAHERDVVHRDLKPANIMLDGTGKVRITDFGLAGMAGEAIRAGTPAYMSPEQLAGGDVSARSDIYSLGLVLYEIFTGQRALEGRNLAELIHKREHSGIVPPSEIVKSLDPKIEAAIVRCLRPTIAERPASALAVAAALPGGDPLAAAIAAGETPSPEMVAAAGQSEALHPAIGLSLVAVVVVGLVACAALSDRYSLYARVPMQKSLDSLQDRARDILTSLGYETRGQDYARGLSINFDVIRHILDTDRSPERWSALDRRTAPVMVFWYRSSPTPLVPEGSNWSPSYSDPPMTAAGMARLNLDDSGRLLELEAVPPRADDGQSRPDRPSPWPALFQAAGLDMSAFRPVSPQLLPRAFATERAAWEGPVPGVDGAILHVEAAAHRGAAVAFRATGPWEPIVPRTTQPVAAANATWRVLANTLGTIMLLCTLHLARSNLRAGRGDRKGAWRLFCFALAAMAASWVVSARHYASLLVEDDRLFEFLAHAIVNTGTVWLLYVALEPYVRRYAPAILISWTRVLAGQFVNPRVGRDVLIGVAVGVAIALLGWASVLVPAVTGGPPPEPRVTNLQLLLGAPTALGVILRMLPNNLQNGLFVAVAFGVGRAITGRVWGGAVLAGGLLSIFVLGESTGRLLLSLLFISAFVIPLVATLLYCGILSVVIAFLVNQAINNSPLTLQPAMPYAPAALWSVLLVAALAAFGFYASRAGQPLFGRLLQTD